MEAYASKLNPFLNVNVEEFENENTIIKIIGAYKNARIIAR